MWDVAAKDERLQTFSDVAVPRDIFGFYNWGSMVSTSQALGSPGPSQKPIRES